MADLLKESLPPNCDYITYLTLIESHICPEILPSLNDILQDPVLTQNIGWDLIHLLLPIPGSVNCLTTIARLGNPREVILKVTEAFKLFQLDSENAECSGSHTTEPANTEKYCTLVNLLSILHPRIKTRYPSRFLSTSLKSILATYCPLNSVTRSIISFLRTISGNKRPLLPDRISNLKLQDNSNSEKTDYLTPDPEAQDEEPEEQAVQMKLLRSFITHILDLYINENPLEWSTRLLENLYPEKVVHGRNTRLAFKEDPELQARDSIVGQLVAISGDLDITLDDSLSANLSKSDKSEPGKELGQHNFSSPEDIIPSKVGTLFHTTSFIFSSIIFKSQLILPKITIFPDHTRLVKKFIGTEGPVYIGSEQLSIIDAILMLGLWLENENNFVAGPLRDTEYLEYLQTISLLSTNTPSAQLRYAAHELCSSVLHAHPVDRLRLTFISDTLENCPYETLRALAVSWLKKEITVASDRKSSDIFATSTALAATQPFLFPVISGLVDASDEEVMEVIDVSYPFHMAVLNFLLLLSGKKYSHVVPNGMMKVVEKIYLRPLKLISDRNLDSFSNNSKVKFQLLGDRIKFCLDEILTFESHKNEK
ncbi:putative yap-binding protein [Golovinomyces cichoracearum]|uniref:Putative yap-binding protein n=1 Tax=Golovinomyces cichoracearum TaxID=62708 RepID=A0A420H9L4_9PEZI|nr:putative yap-binding protein [Golovinomyces cichoracearum]